MPRSIHIEYPDSFYHVMARGNRREAIFFDDHDRDWFVKALGEACAKTGWMAHACGSDWRKVALARRISERTTVGHRWLAERPKMRSAANVSQQLRQKSASEEANHLPPPGLSRWIDKKRSALAQGS